MSKRIKVSVTRTMIKDGDGGFCPVALAIRKATGEYWSVGSKTAVLDYKKVRHHPRSVERFISRFDTGRPVKPFKFWFTP